MSLSSSTTSSLPPPISLPLEVSNEIALFCNSPSFFFAHIRSNQNEHTVKSKNHSICIINQYNELVHFFTSRHHYEWVLLVYEQLLNIQEDNDVALTYIQMAKVLQKMDNLEEAANKYKLAVQIYTAKFGVNDITLVAPTLYDMARVLEQRADIRRWTWSSDRDNKEIIKVCGSASFWNESTLFCLPYTRHQILENALDAYGRVVCIYTNNVHNGDVVSHHERVVIDCNQRLVGILQQLVGPDFQFVNQDEKITGFYKQLIGLLTKMGGKEREILIYQKKARSI